MATVAVSIFQHRYKALASLCPGSMGAHGPYRNIVHSTYCRLYSILFKHGSRV